MKRAGAGLALSAAVLLACASGDSAGAADGAEPDRAEPDAPIAVTGRVTVTGSEPDVRLVIVSEEATYELVGAPAEALRRLQQRRVTVRGRLAREAYGPGFPAQLQVDSYTLERSPDPDR